MSEPNQPIKYERLKNWLFIFGQFLMIGIFFLMPPYPRIFEYLGIEEITGRLKDAPESLLKTYLELMGYSEYSTPRQIYTFLPELGYPLAILGLFIFCWAFVQLKKAGSFTPFPSPKPQGKLVNSGIYKLVRHPIYTGLIVLSLGLSLIDRTEESIIWLVLFGWFLGFKSRFEEKRLNIKFPDDYKEYCKQTSPFLPWRALGRKLFP